MKERQVNFPWWIHHVLGEFERNIISVGFRITFFAVVLIFCSLSSVHAQSEDTTQTEREVPEQPEQRTRVPAETPYNSDILQSDIDRYQLRDYGSSNRFYRQLDYLTVEEFMMREEEGYNRYGAEWERKINEDLLKILRATFKEESDLVKILRILKPFFVFGIWEPYEVPITRVEHPNKVPVEE